MARNGGIAQDLGGGFVAVERRGGTTIEAEALAGTGAIGLMSPLRVDGRLDSDARAWMETLEIAASRRLLSLDQQHGAAIAAARSALEGSFPQADGIWTNSDRDVLAIRTADCAAIWLVDPKHRTLCMLHAGWRGIVKGIVKAGVRELATAGGDPRDFIAAVGPHVGECCFEVGPEVTERFAHVAGAIHSADSLKVPRKRQDSLALDLASLLRAEFAACGIPAAAVHIAATCTRCHPEILHSYRRNGPGGPLAVSIGMLVTLS